MPSEYILALTPANSEHYQSFAPVIQEARQALSAIPSPSGLLIDFTLCRFLEPGYVVTLACLIEEYHQRGLPINFTPSKTRGVDDYLRNIRFYEYWQEGFDRSSYTSTHIDTALCLWQVTQEMIDNYAQQARGYFAQNFLPGKDLDWLSICLAELFNNICDHSKSPVSGYCLTQYYPKTQQLVTAVCDFGVGIPSSINTFWQQQGKDVLSDTDALRIALRKRVTTKSTPRNRGFGLDNLSNIVKNLQGHLFFLSNFALLKQNSEGVLRTNMLARPLYGSLIVVSLNTATLPAVEEELEAGEFSF